MGYRYVDPEAWGSNPHREALKQITRRCVECGRVFDLWDDTDAEEWAYGHDCEV